MAGSHIVPCFLCRCFGDSERVRRMRRMRRLRRKFWCSWISRGHSPGLSILVHGIEGIHRMYSLLVIRFRVARSGGPTVSTVFRKARLGSKSLTVRADILVGQRRPGLIFTVVIPVRRSLSSEWSFSIHGIRRGQVHLCNGKRLGSAASQFYLKY